MQAVLLYVGLEVGRATEGPTLWTAVRGLVCVDPLVGTETALVGQQHLAHRASLGKNTKKAVHEGATGLWLSNQVPDAAWTQVRITPPPTILSPNAWVTWTPHTSLKVLILTPKQLALPLFIRDRPDPVFPKISPALGLRVSSLSPSGGPAFPFQKPKALLGS